MKKFLMVLAVLIFIGGCAARQVVKVPDAVQKDCIDADYKNDGGVFIMVNCHERIIHAVTRLRPTTNYAIFIGDDPMMIGKTSADGILVFVNQFGRNVEMIPEMSDEEMKNIRTGPPTHKATADKGGE